MRSTRSARVTGLVLGHLGRPDLRTGHVVEGQLVLLLGERLEVVLADEDQQVAGDDLLGIEPLGGDLLRLGQGGSEGGLFGGSPGGAEVGPAVAVALVAEDRGGQRVAFEDAFPEAVGEVIDGSIRIGDDGHWKSPPVREMVVGTLGTVRSLAAAAHQPKRSASSAGGVSSSWS